MPAWWAADDEARELNMALPAFLRWAASEAGHRWLPRLRLKWQMQAALRERESAEQAARVEEAHWRDAGWRGGRTAPAGRARVAA